ncbi:1-phosphofructokinase [Konateibacter massiliensis]|uniref:1-phosphofructokinase n=1 Tax=Konateibacter massiliensis TaxID=2002841 RepID=UPI000C14E9D5|nr:1-phosphofructokinase [Konateibacter massiliensis]
MITTITLNVAIDKAYVVDDFAKNTVTRVQTCTNTAGGKGLNVSKVIQLCGEDITATGFVGGHAGAYVEDLLREFDIKTDFVHTKSETRSCINILASDGSSTEFLEPGAPVTPEEAALLYAKIDQLIEQSDVITISGSVPVGIETSIYADLIAKIKKKGRPVILDTSGELLVKGIAACPTLIKPNIEELEALLGIPLTNQEEVIDAACKLHELGIAYITVSLGADGALLVCKEGVFHGKPPKITPVNTVGCGDSMVGAFAVALSRGLAPEEMLRYGVAVSAANALTMATGYFRAEDVARLLPDVSVTQVL